MKHRQFSNATLSITSALTVSNLYFCLCGEMKNDMGHSVAMEMRNAYRRVTENMNAKDHVGDLAGRICLKGTLN